MTPTQQLANQIKEHYSQLANTIEEAYNNNLIDHETYHQHNNYLTETAFLADIVTNQQPNKEPTRQSTHKTTNTNNQHTVVKPRKQYKTQSLQQTTTTHPKHQQTHNKQLATSK